MGRRNREIVGRSRDPDWPGRWKRRASPLLASAHPESFPLGEKWRVKRVVHQTGMQTVFHFDSYYLISRLA